MRIALHPTACCPDCLLPMSQMSVEDDRLEDGLAVAAAGDSTLSQDADALLAEIDGSHEPVGKEPAGEDPAGKDPAGKEPVEGAHVDETGKNDSSNGPSSGSEDDEDDDGTPTGLSSLLDKGSLLISGMAESQESQMTDDGDDYMEAKVRKEFSTIKTSTWMQKKIDSQTGARRRDPSDRAIRLSQPHVSLARRQVSSASWSRSTRRARRTS